MSYLRRQIHVLLLIVCLASLSPLPAIASNWQWQTEGRVIAMSDIHGAHDEFISLLKGVHLIDDSGHWTGGVDHLVIVGDVLDRGADSRDVLALIRQLQAEAVAAGGMVHMLLGNHEIMNLVGDLRYVAKDEYARYADVEDAEHRSKALARFSSRSQDGQADEASILESFSQQHPAGFFGHQQLFSANGELGKWLLTRPVVIRVNNSVFVHGGLSQAMSGRKLDEINAHHQKVLRDYLLSREYFINRGILAASTNFYKQPDTIKQALATKAGNESLSADDEAMAKQLVAAYKSDIFDDDSPTWYRGNVGCSAAVEQNRLRLLLDSLGARRVVIGHTPTVSRAVENRFDELVIRVDTGMLNTHYRGQPAAAIIMEDKVSAYYANDASNKPSLEQARRVGPRPGGLTDMDLERTLAISSILNSEARQDGSIRVSIDYEGEMMEALFTAARSNKRSAAFIPAVAAYRLDRHLGLEMTPVAMARNVEGKDGAITLNLDNLIDEGQRIARQLGGSAWCSLKDQFNMMYVFDILLHNKGRKQNAMRYVSSDMKLILTGNENMLGTEKNVPRYLKAAPFSIPADIKLQLQQMTAESLEELLGDVLDSKRRKAILSRRDKLLKASK